MSVQTFLGGRVTLHAGDCLDVVRALPDASVDSCVTDPPYALVSIGKRFGKDGAAPPKDYGGSGVYQRATSGFMGAKWDHGERAFSVEFWAEIFRVLKPGGHVLVFAATRTHHRLTCAIEDAGFEIRDMVAWLYGSGFPKSHDVSKGIDKAAGAEREVVGPNRFAHLNGKANLNVYGAAARPDATAPATDAARQWQGWGTALKPALEPICVARKPLIGTVAQNVLTHGTGALNIDGCRVGIDETERDVIDARSGAGFGTIQCEFAGRAEGQKFKSHAQGRWPANLVHDGSDEVVGAFPESNIGGGPQSARQTPGSVWGIGAERSSVPGGATYGDSGSAARFFASFLQDEKRFHYSSKAGDDRLGSRHPTVKPVALMQWLVRLVTPKGGVCLDPFAGTGTTAEAAYREGMRCILIEREAEYIADIERRMSLVLGGPDERRHAIVKAKGKTEHAGPLFGFDEAAE